MSKKFTLEEIKKHKDEKNAWIVIQKNVYDVTKFLNEHPGGKDVLLEQTGKDSTKEFNDVGHSDNAKKLLDKYKIGSVDEQGGKSK